MIANGGSYRCGWWWSDHLQAAENDRAQVLKSFGLRSETIYDMLREMEAVAQGTRCQNYFYQINLNPLAHEVLSADQWERARQIAEKHHGLEGQPYFVVEHVKNGRVHHHVLWSRIDLENMRAIPDSHDARRNHAIAREIEQELGLERVTGPYDREPGEPRPKRAPKPWAMYRGMKTGLDPRDIAAEVTELFNQSDNGNEFYAALERHGYILARGDRRGFMIVDTAGKEHSLARRIEGVNTKALNEFMRDVDPASLPTVEEAKTLHQERRIAELEADRATVRREIEWEEELARAANEKGQKAEPSSGLAREAAPGPKPNRVRDFDEATPLPGFGVRKEPRTPNPATLSRGTARLAGAAAELVADSIESLFAPRLTPEQKTQGEIAQRQKQDDAEHTADFSRYTSEAALAQQRLEQERENSRQRDKDDRER